jgi:AhpD family alkylhydroperoxidase
MECKLLQEEEATGKARELYDEIKASFGMVPNFFKAQAALDRKTKEIIAMVVSLLNHCQYCHLAHKTMARMCGAKEEELQEAVMVLELFQSFTAIADSLEVPCDVMS